MEQLTLNFDTIEPFDVRILDATDWIILRLVLEANELMEIVESSGTHAVYAPDAVKAYEYLQLRYDDYTLAAASSCLYLEMHGAHLS